MACYPRRCKAGALTLRPACLIFPPPALPCPSLLCLPGAGEEPHTGIIAGITPGNPTLVTTVEDERLEFQDGQCCWLGRQRWEGVGEWGLPWKSERAVWTVSFEWPLPTRPPPPPPLLPPAGEEVTFSEVVGMTELNGRAPLRVQNCKAHSFHLDVDSTGFQ